MGHTVVASDRSRLYSWGEAFSGKLGLGCNHTIKVCEHAYRPQEIRKRLLGPNGEVEYLVKNVACANSFTLILR